MLQAVAHAERIIGWYDTLDRDEIPPEWMWPFPKELVRWFDQVREDRKERYGANGDSSDAPRTDRQRQEWMGQNELTASIRR